ncbi:Fic family protein [Jiella endophytica]|uniref:Fic family protein n=1 Tax=Jiella endophytica TaxID=2558362 RepID=UPI003CCA7CA1
MSFAWLSRAAIEAMHDEQIAEHGGLAGLRDENALEAALARPQNKFAYGEADIFELAASQLFALA